MSPSDGGIASSAADSGRSAKQRPIRSGRRTASSAAGQLPTLRHAVVIASILINGPLGSTAMGEWINAAEAAQRLGVKPATLYAYVSRGMLARRRGDDGRSSLFEADEVARLAG